ncbi:M20/M25/M40 family metallo-hydrolase [Novosphingobium sp.]|uniref:M20/M25/M40 family metallo-hydrolase n=1 Tax=Novosphingobium sp. TaxID=1874826 RepID=UPI0025DF0940|nr:M20/M25/M40 family metallo-hydrolase [Novosphingobium sp.]
MGRVIALLLAVSFACAPAVAASRAEKERSVLIANLRAHITELASDAYDGREPGTEGETLTLRYLGRQWFDIGLESGTNDPGHAWFTPVSLIGREPDRSAALFSRKGRRVAVPGSAVLVLTSGKRSLLENAPILFVGKGDAIPPRAELAGRIALMLDGGRDGSERQNAMLGGGASAVLTVLDSSRTIDTVVSQRRRLAYGIAGEELGGDLETFISAAALDRALTGTGQSVAGFQKAAQRDDFTPIPVDLNATFEATTRETRINTHNMIGRLLGKRPDAGAVLIMAHWDHFGRCAPQATDHQICNGAIDNASGLAAMTEIARRLARAPQLDRDVYFVATTGEELGLLGAEAFAENPPVPLKQIVAAFNIDSVALAPAGQPFAVIGAGMTPLDVQIAAVARQQKRKIAPGNAANAFVKRQDGWALMQHDVPAVMISSSWSDLGRVERFMNGDYHRPTDRVKPDLELGGAADDVDFHVALARWFGDLKKVPAAGK